MQAVNVCENRKFQKKIVGEFIEKVKRKRFLNKEDFEEVFKFFKEIVNIESNVSTEYKVLSNNLENLSQISVDSLPDREWIGMDILRCELSNTNGADVVFYFDPVYFCKRYFGRDEINKRLNGVIELLILIYKKIYYAEGLTYILKCYLSPKIFEFSSELVLKEIIEPNFYDENYRCFSFSRYSTEYSYNTVLEILSETDIINMAKSNINNKISEKNNFAFSKIGKINYNGKLFSKECWLSNIIDNSIKKNRKIFYSFPIFEKIYYINGKAKTIHEIFEEMTYDLKKIMNKYDNFNSYLHQEYDDCKKFYYEIILPLLKIATDEDYKKLAEKYGVLSLQSFLSGMEKYFNTKVQEKIKSAKEYIGEGFESLDEIENELKKNINAITRFRNGVKFSYIADTLLRNGGFVRGTREFLPYEVLKRHEMFASSLIDIYDAFESEEEYKLRAENEKSDIDEVINALYYNRFENFFSNLENKEDSEIEAGKEEIIRMAQILKIAKILSYETGINYFSEFLTVPDVNKVMLMFESKNNEYLTECMKNIKLRIKKCNYPDTEAENGKYKKYILGLEETDDGLEFKRKISMLNEELA